MTSIRRVLTLAALVLMLTGTAAAQLIPDPDVQGKISDARQQITITGKIAYSQELGGYFLQSDKAGNKIILNQNYEVLKQTAQNRKEVKVQGRVNPVDVMARHIFIDKLDGSPYKGDKAPLVKPPGKLTPLF